MTTKTDLLPLPEPVAVKYPDSGLRDDEYALRLWAAHGYDTGGEPLFSAEHLREATAPLQAEVEALREEVSAVKESLSTDLRAMRAERERAMEARQLISGDLATAEARADKLAEALKEILSRSAMNLAMNPNPFELTAILGDIHQIAGSALEQEADRG